MFGLVVRFTCKDQASAEAFDRLVAATVDKIRTNEPGTLVYAVNRVDAEPLQRVFYELYRDRAAFDAHEDQEHTKKFLDEREQYLSATEVDWVTLLSGKGTAG
jgi:quinol monooxygenase YgiN